MKKNISIAVITYNSEKTVLETLNSIATQTYGTDFIELIISDDGSADNTTGVIDEWLRKYGDNFNKVVFIKNENNLGVSKNINMAWRASTSEWIKTVAGDDILLPSCIADNVAFLAKDSDVSNIGAVFSLLQIFSADSSLKKRYIGVAPSRVYLNFFKLTPNEQYSYLKEHGIPMAPSSFIQRSALISVNYADERFRLIEDYPLWLKMSQHGFSLRFLDKNTVMYRKSESISSSQSKIINENFLYEVSLIDELIIFPKLSKRDFFFKIRKRLWSKLMRYIVRIFDNKKSVYSDTLVMGINFLKPGFISFQMYKMKLHLISKLPMNINEGKRKD
ncbi:glycosyltransferase family 2 protein [Vibrio cholerae]|uniref:glycosyltransferase family 2 protein n=1 Tax=Vibrio cholerae TaxID=666 RepID=UPI002DAC0ED4|nr:glycosyltransferase [Vibrio cholerae]MEB5517683.1 glycosyltransferase [Vibrio cholerae]